jgi:hypothetical protein
MPATSPSEIAITPAMMLKELPMTAVEKTRRRRSQMTNDEIQMSKEIQMTNDQMLCLRWLSLPFGFGHSFVIRHSRPSEPRYLGSHDAQK